jgi:hypothetical protein
MAGESLLEKVLTSHSAQSPRTEDRTMQTVAQTTTPIQHYAYYGDLYGTAELLNGSGYLFREDGQRQATLVSYKDATLMLLGLVDLSDMQHEVDLLVGGAAAVACSREEGRA